jgi:hypothetical protein
MGDQHFERSSQLPTILRQELFLNWIMALESTKSDSSGFEKESSGFEKEDNHFSKRDHNALEAELPEYTPGGTFETAGLENYYSPIESYEGKHRYDPEYKWSPEDEKKVVRKVREKTLIQECGLMWDQIDFKICSWVCLMFFALQLDRGNISQALSDNMLKDLHLNTNDYNTGMTIFYLCFLSAEVPSQLISKRMKPEI